MRIYCIYNSMNVCKWRMGGSATKKCILLSVLLRLNKIFNQSINQSNNHYHHKSTDGHKPNNGSLRNIMLCIFTLCKP